MLFGIQESEVDREIMNIKLNLPGSEDIVVNIDLNRKIWHTTHWGWGRIAKQWGGVIETRIVPRSTNTTIDVNDSPVTVPQHYFTTDISCFNGAGSLGWGAKQQVALLNAFANPPRFPAITVRNFRLAAFVLRDALIANMPNNRGGDFIFTDRPNNTIDLAKQTAGRWGLVP